MILPSRIKKGDTIGVIAPSSPVVGEKVNELKHAIKIVQQDGFKVKLGEHIYSNSNQYSATASEKAEDINQMFKDKNVKMIWCSNGGENCNTVFDKLDYDMIKQNPKIICGYSDITSITNIITEKTGLVTYSSTNFKTISTDETYDSYELAKKMFVKAKMQLGDEEEKYKTIQKGIAEGELIGGNLSLIRGMVCGKYSLNFEEKILFIEELGFETDPALASNYLYYMKQNGVFDKIKGLWIGNYEHESGIALEKIVLDTLEEQYKFPIIKSNNFGHIERKITIPIGTKARIDTDKKVKIELIEDCIM